MRCVDGCASALLAQHPGLVTRASNVGLALDERMVARCVRSLFRNVLKKNVIYHMYNSWYI